MASTIRYTLLSLRGCERDGDMLKAPLIFSHIYKILKNVGAKRVLVL